MIPRVHSWLNKHILCSLKHPGDNENGTSVRRHEFFFKFFLADQKYLVAYFTEDTVSRLRSIDDVPQLASLSVPHGKFKSARSAKGRPDYIFNPESDSPVFPRLEYVPHAPRSPSISPTTPHTEDTWSPVTSENEPMLVAHSPSFSAKVSSEDSRENLVPLHYLQDNAPPRRNPTDEKILMLLTSRSFQADDTPRRFGVWDLWVWGLARLTLYMRTVLSEFWYHFQRCTKKIVNFTYMRSTLDLFAGS